MSKPSDKMQRLGDPAYLAFPFRMGESGPATSRRGDHIREQIEQVIFTTPGERVFRPEFGAGAKTLVFEPNSSALWDVTKRRLQASLAEALRGEVDPSSLEVEVFGSEETMELVIRYRLTTVGVSQQQRFRLGGTSG